MTAAEILKTQGEYLQMLKGLSALTKGYEQSNAYNNVCADCPNAPHNGGSGICGCTLPISANPVTC